MLLTGTINLEELRVTASITQKEMADHLGISQSQVSRYEQDPEEVPQKYLVKWVQFCGHVSSSRGMEIPSPRGEIESRLQLVQSYLQSEPTLPSSVLAKNVPATAASFAAGIAAISRKPRVGVLGRFDMGKSRLSNVLLGGDRLPASYTPTTSVICLIRHMSEKPSWQAEDVWMMAKGFNLDLADNEAHCLQHKLYAGGYEALRQYGTHRPNSEGQQVFAAVAYIDAPILLGCDMVDLPGYDSGKQKDDEKAEMGQKMVDVMIYLSMAQGFLDQRDLGYQSVLLRHLPTYESKEGGVSPLRNLMIVATRSDIVGDQAPSILDSGSERAYKHLEYVLAERAELTGVKVSHDAFRRRFFTFSAENAVLRSSFEADLKDLLVNIIPKVTLSRINGYVTEAKATATEQCDLWIHGLSQALEERDLAQTAIQKVLEDEPARVSKKEAHEKRILAMVDDLKKESAGIVSKVFGDSISIATIEAMIKERYSNKKEAQQLAGSYLLEAIQSRIASGIQTKAKIFAEEVDGFLAEYNTSIEGSPILNDSLNFNARATFMGAIAGIGTFGALAAWASIAAAGSNLGAYLLVPTVVSFLSSIGIGVGGTSAAISFIAALGGPITIAIALSAFVALIAGAFFGDSWQTKLAKKIRESVLENGVESKILSSMNKYWDDTKTAFVKAVSETEHVYKSRIDSLHTMAFSTSRDVLEKELEYARALRSFFADIPWEPIRS